MTTKDERESAKLNRDKHDASARERGHNPIWKLAPNSTRRGHAYYFVGECRHCGARESVASLWSSSDSVADLRADVCGGPGTAILTEIEEARVAELIAPALAEFAAAVQRVKYATAPLN